MTIEDRGQINFQGIQRGNKGDWCFFQPTFCQEEWCHACLLSKKRANLADTVPYIMKEATRRDEVQQW